MTPTMQLIALDEERNAVKRSVEASLNFTIVWEMFRQWLVLFFQSTSSASSFSVPREWSPSLMSISITRKNFLADLLPSLVPCLMASVKLEEFIREVIPSSSLELSQAAKDSYYKLLVGFKPLCKIYYVLFQKLLYAMEQFGEEITQVNAVPCDPPTTLLGLQNLPTQIITN